MMQFLGTCYWQLSKSLGYLGQNLTFPEAAGGTYLHLAGKDLEMPRKNRAHSSRWHKTTTMTVLSVQSGTPKVSYFALLAANFLPILPIA